MSGMFLRHPDGTLVEMTEEPYDSEAMLQRFIADAPALIAGDQVDPEDPRRWLLIRQEAGIPGEEEGSDRWSLDHLLLDQDGVPTLVEVKRSSDTRIRREVVGQMLDYAANLTAFVPVERMQALLEARCADAGLDAGEEVLALSEFDDVDEYWSRVKSNLDAGRIRLLFVADKLPVELRRIIEFLNRHTDPVEVLGVEVRQYVGEDDLRTLVPRVFGQTVEATAKKTGRTRSRLPSRQWDEGSYFPEIEERVGAEAAGVARRIYEWAQERDLRVWWGKGAQTGSFIPILDYGDEWHSTMWVATDGRIELQFAQMAPRPPFAEAARREALLARLNSLPEVAIPPDGIDRMPSIRLADLQAVIDDYLAVWDWYLDQVRAHYDG